MPARTYFDLPPDDSRPIPGIIPRYRMSASGEIWSLQGTKGWTRLRPHKDGTIRLVADGGHLRRLSMSTLRGVTFPDRFPTSNPLARELLRQEGGGTSVGRAAHVEIDVKALAALLLTEIRSLGVVTAAPCAETALAPAEAPVARDINHHHLRTAVAVLGEKTVAGHLKVQVGTVRSSLDGRWTIEVATAPKLEEVYAMAIMVDRGLDDDDILIMRRSAP